MKQHVIILFALMMSSNIFGQSGKVVESLVFESKKVNYPLKYSIYLPPDYDTSRRSYPVLYLLHGYSDDETGWIQYGEVNTIADRGINNGDFSPLIIVIPDGKATWYINNVNGNDPWEDMFIQEFIPFIENEYRVRSKKDFRAIGGLSMGGYGALMLSMRNSQFFSSCLALSAAIFTDEEIFANNMYDRYFGNVFGPKPVNGVINDYWKAHNPLHLLDRIDKELLKSVHFYIDRGDDDFLYKGNSALHVKMRDLEIPHEYRVKDGAHNWSYWRTSLFDGLIFISDKFRL